MKETAVLTGCSSGFGRQLSERLARNGNRVYATVRDMAGKNAGIARELQSLAAASSGIDVVIVEPGPFTTALFSSSPQPADADGRAKTYPAVAQQTFEQMGAAFASLFSNPDTPTDPELVVDRIVELAGMKPGSRPLRGVVGVDFGVRDLNASVEPHEVALTEALGLSAFATLARNAG